MEGVSEKNFGRLKFLEPPEAYPTLTGSPIYAESELGAYQAPLGKLFARRGLLPLSLRIRTEEVASCQPDYAAKNREGLWTVILMPKTYYEHKN